MGRRKQIHQFYLLWMALKYDFVYSKIWFNQVLVLLVLSLVSDDTDCHSQPALLQELSFKTSSFIETYFSSLQRRCALKSHCFEKRLLLIEWIFFKILVHVLSSLACHNFKCCCKTVKIDSVELTASEDLCKEGITRFLSLSKGENETAFESSFIKTLVTKKNK